VTQRDRRDPRMPRIRVADVVVHDQDRAHVTPGSLASGVEATFLDSKALKLAIDRLRGREDDVLEALRCGDRGSRRRDPREAPAEARLGQPGGDLCAEPLL